jgi:cell division protein FtsZ
MPVAAAPEPAAQFEPEPEPVMAVAADPEPAISTLTTEPTPAPVVQAPPKIFEPLRAAAYAQPAARTAPVADEVELPMHPALAHAEPIIAEPEVRAVARIVDPSVAEEEELEPLFTPSTHYADDRRQKGGWLSLFGRPRHDAPQPSARSGGGGAQPALQVAQDDPVEDGDDLEIPSFLRRLAN